MCSKKWRESKWNKKTNITLSISKRKEGNLGRDKDCCHSMGWAKVHVNKKWFRKKNQAQDTEQSAGQCCLGRRPKAHQRRWARQCVGQAQDRDKLQCPLGASLPFGKVSQWWACTGRDRERELLCWVSAQNPAHCCQVWEIWGLPLGQKTL